MSITSITPFTNDNNLYIPSTTSANIYQAALPVFNVTLDITGTARNSFQSTMGAHEFTGTYLDNIAPRIFNLTDPTGCQSGPIVLNFNIYDKQLIGDSLYYKINGGTTISIQSTISVGTARRYVLPAQPSGTLIEFRVSAIDFNTPANVGSFPTNKIWDTLSTGITSFPYTNGFEGVNNPTWTSQTITNGATWEIGSLGSSNNPPQGARSGVRSAIFRSSTFPIAGSSAQLVSPCLDFTNLISPTIRFYISQNSDLPNKRDSIQVKVSFGGNIWSNSLRAVERVNGDFALPGYRMVEVCLAAYKTSGLRIALEAYSSGTGQNIQIDDIMIYDDVQAQAISPKLFSQCLRDSIKINITNSDVRYSYRAVNSANGQTLATKDGEGTNMQLGFLPMVVDTMRYFVEASNASSRAVNTGFGGGFITCSNILPDTITAVINRFYNGPFITAGTPFEGSYNAGDANNPDGTKVGSVITYQFVPPAFYTNANYGSLWSIPTIQVYSAGGFVPFTNYTFTAPSASGPGTIRLTAPATMLDSNIVFNYTIRINASGCDSSFSRQLRISTPPTANFNYTPPSTNLCAKNNILFSAVISTKPANNFPFTFTWVFGDGTFSFVENPTKVYDASGPFTVKFILTDRFGNTSEKTEVLTILPAPSVDFATNIPCANDSTTFTPTSQPAGSTFLWTMPNTSTQTREIAKFNFAKFDTAYSVRLRITNTSGCFNTAIKSIYVFAKPTANFTTAPHCLSNNVPIINTSSIPTGNIGYSWNWGNGQTSLSATPTYKYPASGTYSATLIASSPFGCLDSIIKAVTIYDRPFTGFNVVNPCVGENDITVFNNTTTFAGGSTNVNYNWNFGDLKSSTIQNPTNAYRGVGSYNVTMLAVDKLNGCRDSVARNITIFYKPVAQFAVSGTGSVCENNEFKVINTSYTIDQGGFKCNWNWGDSKSDTICNVNHIYTAHGFYNATLIVRTPNGCSDTTTIPVTVNLPPIGVITVTTIDSANYPCGKNRKMLTASIPDAESYSWQMGDAGGSTRSGNNQDFVFAARGTYKVKCTIKDQSGCIIITNVDVVIDCAVGVQDVLAAKYDLNAYPNPFSQSTNLSFELPNATDVKVTILDMLGRTIKTIDLGRMQSGKHNQSLEDFGAAGSYLIKVDLDGTSVYKQVIKQ
jgi:PKD repeat protein